MPNNMNIHIATQYMENYGTPERPYWKYKGGSTYVVEGFTHPLNDRIGAAGAAVVEALRPTLEYANSMAEEYIIDWSFESVDALTENERLQLEYDGRVTYPDKRIPLPQ